MAVERLPRPVLDAALQQIVSAPGFRPANPHLSAQQVAAIARGQWPQEPVFTPYANTHHGYSQSQSPQHRFFLTATLEVGD